VDPITYLQLFTIIMLSYLVFRCACTQDGEWDWVGVDRFQRGWVFKEVIPTT